MILGVPVKRVMTGYNYISIINHHCVCYNDVFIPQLLSVNSLGFVRLAWRFCKIVNLNWRSQMIFPTEHKPTE